MKEVASLWPNAETCCDTIRVSSTSLAQDMQPRKLGVYTSVGIMNSRKVYKQKGRDEFVYYHDWGDGRGENWMMGSNPGKSNRGIESINLEGRALDAQWCPEDVNKSKFPFKAYTARGNWVADTRLRVECFSLDVKCCEVILVLSQGNAGIHQPGRMGVYVSEGEWNGRLTYKHTDIDEFIFYHDWGPNSGANWMFSNEVGSTNRGIESSNVEAGVTNHTQCLAEVGMTGRIGPWMVWTADSGWKEDLEFSLE